MEEIRETILNPSEELNIVELAKEKRRSLDLGMGPIGEKIFSVLRNNNIQLLYFALEPMGSESLAALYLEKYNSISDKYSYYIAINTQVPVDLQIFNACHEYFHHIDDKKKELHLQRIGSSDDELTNAKANRFAAEFLLPTETLITYVRKHNRGKIDLISWNKSALLRLIVQLQIEFQVPYQMIVKRLSEIKSITCILRDELLEVNERSNESSYYRLGTTMDKEIFKKLNSTSEKVKVDTEALNLILQNFDEGTISLDSAVKDLSVFDKTLEDFGYEIDILDDDIEELEQLFGDDN